ncbi:hypothetical protein Agub_g8204 [Astrephomene gubernaculifera]|uniref:Major facilitator superfamily (MFS) profile domain-containing protein n=1 Tax=Astrephomene gubernaculifera TaxID=47775 RepID=A0AAD3DRB6_9CHLO|nr:hypothetical protein Agub_g8204 [Astrephomene gubernaculifera]
MAAGTSPPGGLSFDDALTKYVGEFGRSQIRTMLIASLFWVGNALLILLMVFHASPSPIKEHWWHCNDANDSRCTEVFALKDPTREVCDLPRDSWSWTQPSKSIISQFNLICGAAWKSQFANSGFFMGYLIGSGYFGGLADTRGRKQVLFGCTAIGALFTMAAGLSPNYIAYFIFRLITGIGAAGQALTTYILATESIGPSWRGTAGVATQLFFIAGEFLLVLVAYVARPWRSLCFTCSVLNAVLLLLWPTLSESPRWLLVRGRREEATAIIARIAAVNGRAMPSEPLAAADPDPSPAAAAATAAAAVAVEEGVPLKSSSSSATAAPAPAAGAPASPQKPVTLTAMLRKDRHMLRRFLVLAYVWLVICLAYYGISLALGGLPGSIYVSFMIAAAAELPSNILAAWMIERYGRHNTMAAGMLLGGAACLGCAFVPPGIGSSVLAAMGKFGCAGAFTVASIFTSEMFPTLVRSAVLGAENEAARVGGIAAPFIVLLGATTGQGAMPFIIFGVASLVAGGAIFTLPETLGTTMPDTMADMAGIQSIFTTQPWRRGGWRQTLREMFRTHGSGIPNSSAHGTRTPPLGTPSKHSTAHATRTSPSVSIEATSAGGAHAPHLANHSAAVHAVGPSGRSLVDSGVAMEVEALHRANGSGSGGGAAGGSRTHGEIEFGRHEGAGLLHAQHPHPHHQHAHHNHLQREEERHTLLSLGTAKSDVHVSSATRHSVSGNLERRSRSEVDR